MNTDVAILQELKLKVVRLLKDYMHLKVQAQLQLEELSKLKQVIENQNKELEALAERNKIVNIADRLNLSAPDSRELKLKLNEYIRELDECIRMLSE